MINDMPAGWQSFSCSHPFPSFQTTFRVNLSVFLDCLNMFGKAEASALPVGLRMSYKGYGHPLELMLEESGVVTDCRLKTMESSGNELSLACHGRVPSLSVLSRDVTNCYSLWIITKAHIVRDRKKEQVVTLDRFTSSVFIKFSSIAQTELLNFDFNSTNICSKIIMNAECLKVAFSELDMTSDLLEILISPEDPYFRWDDHD